MKIEVILGLSCIGLFLACFILTVVIGILSAFFPQLKDTYLIFGALSMVFLSAFGVINYLGNIKFKKKIKTLIKKIKEKEVK